MEHVMMSASINIYSTNSWDYEHNNSALEGATHTRIQQIIDQWW
jgi:hypothetical protein